MASFSLITALLAPIALGALTCSKKKVRDEGSTSVVAATTDAGEDTLLNRPVSTEALAITSLDGLGISSSAGSSLHLAGKPYESDKARLRVDDPALEALGQAISLICFFNQAAYIEMVGKGPYRAQVDRNSCAAGGETRAAQGASSGSTHNISTIIVEVTRASRLHPLLAKAWITTGGEGETAEAMQVKLIVAEGQNAKNPLGIFSMSWEGGPLEGDTERKGFVEAKRAAESNTIKLRIVDEIVADDKTFTLQAASELSYDAERGAVTGGSMHAKVPSWDEATQAEVTKEFALSFNDSRVLRRSVSENTESCLAKNEFVPHISRYGLYHAGSGARVTRESGFPIVYTDADKLLHYGWAGYWGVWLGEGRLPTEGMIVQQFDAQSAGKIDYTVRLGAGKLIKKSKQLLPLDQLAGIVLEASSATDSLLVSYDKDTRLFSISGKKVYSSGGSVIEAATGTYSLRQAAAAVPKVANRFQSTGLGGLVIVYSDASGLPVGDAIYYTEENVTATAGALDLYCYQFCLKSEITAVQALANPYDTAGTSNTAYYPFNEADPLSASHQRAYTYSSANMVLKIAGLPATLASGVTELSSLSSWGLRSGPMVTTPATDPFALYEADAFYEWETGPNPWNQYIALIDTSGNAKTFEAPLSFAYTHEQGQDRGGDSASLYTGKSYLLNYLGFAALQGLPGEVDSQGRWQNSFELKDGAQLGSNQEYKVKALDGMLSLKEKAGSCAGLSIGGLPELPTLAGWKAPQLGDAPDASDAPAVIEGIVQ